MNAVKLTTEQREYIEAIYEGMHEALYSYAYSVLKDRFSAEEAVQETFRIACVRINTFVGASNQRGWLFKTLRYMVRGTIRKQAYLNTQLTYGYDLNDVIDRCCEVDVCVDLLYLDISRSTEYRLLHKVILDQASILEVAREMGISEDACKKRVQRAKGKLRRYFCKGM
ncbi:RNA polymerase sigma factor [Fusibacter sp. JL298sf-3]